MDSCKMYGFGTVEMHHSRSDRPQASSFERHCHTTYEIVYVAEGDGYYMYEGERHPLGSGMLALVLPCKFHHAEPRGDAVYDRYVINFAPDDIPTELVDYISEFGSAVMKIGGDDRDAFLHILSRMEELTEINPRLRIPMARLLVGELLVWALRGQPVRQARTDTSLGAMVIKYINERITSKITLDDIARDFFVSKSYLCRAFKEYNKISVFGYINGKRVAMARRLIEEGSNASDAAYSVGFSDYSTFFRAYKRAFGVSPASARADVGILVDN